MGVLVGFGVGVTPGGRVGGGGGAVGMPGAKVGVGKSVAVNVATGEAAAIVGARSLSSAQPTIRSMANNKSGMNRTCFFIISGLQHGSVQGILPSGQLQNDYRPLIGGALSRQRSRYLGRLPSASSQPR